jgi:membrane-associated phospholipid phosphatase
MSVDLSLFALLNRGFGSPLLDGVVYGLTNLHKQFWFLVPVLLACGWALWKGGRRGRVWVVCALLAVGASDLFSHRLLKDLLPRDRPCHRVGREGAMAFAQTRLVGECPGSKSFPSNHAANMAALGGVGVWMTAGRKRWLWLLIPLIIGYTRIYLGYHYPSDVLGGWIVGGMMATVCYFFLRRLLPPSRAAAQEG